MSSLPRVVVMDWGIGGVDTLQRLQARVGAEWLYLSDSGQPPYGLLDDEALMDVVDMQRWCPTVAYASVAALKVRDMLASVGTGGASATPGSSPSGPRQ